MATSRHTFLQECLSRTNEHRSKHGVPGLVLNPRISAVAQAWADELLRKDVLAHNPKARYLDSPLGENIAFNYKSHAEVTGSEMIDQWYNEIKDYNFNTHSSSKTVGHFTQLVWKNSREVGFGLSASNGTHYLVANYYPAGNYSRQYVENVFPPQTARSSANAFFKTNKSPNDRPRPVQNQPAFQEVNLTFNLKEGNPKPDGLLSKNTTNNDHDLTGFKSSWRNQQPEKPTWKIKSGRDSTAFPDQFSKMNLGERAVNSTLSGPTFDNLDLNKFGRDNLVVYETFDEPGSFKVTRHYVTNRKDGFTNTAGTSGVEHLFQNIQEVQKSGEQFVDEVVSGHNRYRSRHKASSLTINHGLSMQAQRWAEKLARSEELSFSDNKHSGQLLGEGLAMKYSSAQVDYEASELVDNWYKEKEHYNFDNPNERTGIDKFGHFTQMIWRGSREIGVGKAWSQDGKKVFVVCNYFPGGNVIGSFRENVLK